MAKNKSDKQKKAEEDLLKDINEIAKNFKEKNKNDDTENSDVNAQTKTPETEIKRAETEEDLVPKADYLRLLAEYNNYQKRTAKEKLELGEFITANTIKPFLEVLDNFERADLSDKGIKLIYEQFKKTITDIGVTEVECEIFDPNFHNAIKTVDAEDKESDTIAEVYQKGYKYNDKVIRPAMVAVFN
ncbi:MAG: nucleotide exchange factor GrpE [Ruminococcus sp.]|jgi:molecular chaperone GrpE|nr:nucleotide exchange factor GrpE [Ruminococcus sp.]